MPKKSSLPSTPSSADALREMNGDVNPLAPREFESYADYQKSLSQKEKDYMGFLQARLQAIKEINDAPYPELDNKTRYQVYEEAKKLANTSHVDPKVDPDDVTVSSGIIEQKLDALLSHINNLNLSADVFAFDKDNNELAELGLALQDIIHDTEIQDGADGAGDEEKKILRQKELLTAPAVFVMEEWSRRFEIRKKLKGIKKFDGDLTKYQGYDEVLEKVFDGPSRSLLHFPNVFLGDMTKFYMEDQPDLFVLVKTGYEDAKASYGKFPMFKFVAPGALASSVSEENKTIFENKWRLAELEKDQVEILMYQCKARDEFQVVINGVMMLPIGFPLSAVVPGGGYNIAKQVFRVINPHFALGKPFVLGGSIKYLSGLIDEMLKLFILKERKAIAPAYVNTSGRVISRKVLAPGRISMGIEPGSLTPIAGTESQGITAGEAAVLSKYEELINKATVSEQFTGQQGKAGMTATESVELQRQAKLSLGLAVASCALLEKKLAHLRLMNIICHWFNPIDKKVMDIEAVRKDLGGKEEKVKEKVLKDTYRSTRNEASIDGEGMGERQVLTVGEPDEIPTDVEIREEELAEEARLGRPVQRIYISSEGIRNAKLRWFVQINPREKESSPFFKMLYREMLGDMMTLMNMGSQPNLAGLEEEFGRVWSKPRNKFFAGGSPMDSAGLAALSGMESSGPAKPSSNPNQSSGAPSGPIPMAGASGGLA